MSQITIKGIYRDVLSDAGGHPIFDSGWKSNVIVLRCRVLLAGFMKNETALGIRSLQVGRGDAAWDAVPPPVPNPDMLTQLVDSAPFIIPQTDLILRYLDESDGVVAGPTHRLEIVATLGPGQPTPATDPPYPLREFGLFGELNGVPYMIDYIRHPLIEKDGSVTLERRVRLIF
jgi:hypothetical protein